MPFEPLTTDQKAEKAKLHSELRSFLAAHGIQKKKAAEFFGEDQATFYECLAKGRYGIDKLKRFLDQKEDLLESEFINQ